MYLVKKKETRILKEIWVWPKPYLAYSLVTHIEKYKLRFSIIAPFIQTRLIRG